MSIKMKPFKALCDYQAVSFTNFDFGDNRVPKEKDLIQGSQDILKVLKENL